MSGVIEHPKEAATIKSEDAIDRLLAKWTDAIPVFTICSLWHCCKGHELQTTIAG